MQAASSIATAIIEEAISVSPKTKRFIITSIICRLLDLQFEIDVTIIGLTFGRTVFDRLRVLMSHNTFAYCSNNPIINTDSNGFVAVCCFDENGNIGTLMSVVMGGGSGGGGRTMGGYVVLDTVRHMDKEDWINEAVNVATTVATLYIMKGTHWLGLAFHAEALNYFSSKAIGYFVYGMTVANGLGLSYTVRGALRNATGKKAKPVSRNDFVKDFATEFIPLKIPTWVEVLSSYLSEAIDWDELLPDGK